MPKTDTTPPPEVIDLADLDPAAACAKGYELELVHPASKRPLGIFITVLGAESPEYQRHVRARVEEGQERHAAAERRGESPKPLTLDQIDKRAAALLAAVTTGWRGVVWEGAEMPFTEANARKVYESRRFVRDQVDRAVHDLGNFMHD